MSHRQFSLLECGAAQPTEWLIGFIAVLSTRAVPAGAPTSLAVGELVDMMRHIPPPPTSTDERFAKWLTIGLILQLGHDKGAPARRMREVGWSHIEDLCGSGSWPLFQQVLGKANTDPTPSKEQEIGLFLHRHFRERITVNKVCRSCGLSVKNATRMFRSAYGISIKRALDFIRFAKAFDLLTTTDGKIEYMAADVGFASRRAMYSHIRRLAGCTPGDLRRAARRATLQQRQPQGDARKTAQGRHKPAHSVA